MLSYRHEYHAGNHADVLKHLCQIAVLDYMLQKEKPITYVDTHAGQGLYKLTGRRASQTKEYKDGIGRLITAEHPLLERYASFFDHEWYAGSVSIAQSILRPTDRLRCYELHSSDFERLADNTRHDRRVKCFETDGFKGLIAQLPPQDKRAAVMIDPSYELKSDYHQVINTLTEALKRFATGVYMIWYPLLEGPEVTHFHRKLSHLKSAGQKLKALDLQLTVRHRSPGMYGSGMFIINPPWTLKEQMQAILPLLQKQLGNEQASFHVHFNE